MDGSKRTPPTPAEVAEARKAAGLTQAQAAALVDLGAPTRWGEYECGRRKMQVYRWELFTIKTGNHPDYVPSGNP